MIKPVNKLRILFASAIVVIFFSCISTVHISDDLSPAELIQRAQEATDKNRYNNALQYYQALYDRNRNNIDLIITAEYEIAFIHYKQKKYHQARSELSSLLRYYNSPDQELLPQQFKRLAEIVIERIDEAESYGRIPRRNR